MNRFSLLQKTHSLMVFCADTRQNKQQNNGRLMKKNFSFYPAIILKIKANIKLKSALKK